MKTKTIYLLLFLFVLQSCKKETVTPPAETSIHLTLGNPSTATNNTTNANNYLLVKPQFALSYNNNTGEANWVSWYLSSDWLGSEPRCDCFATDTALPASFFRAAENDYTGSGFDRGHLCPSADRDKNATDNAATFLMTNIMPQAPNLNRITWADLEDYCRTLASQGNELYIISGGYGSGGNGNQGGITSSLGLIKVPSHYFKVVVILPLGDDDAARVSTSTRVIAVDMPNTQTVNTQSWGYYRTSVDAIEAATGYDFLSVVSSTIQNNVEAGVDDGPTQ